MRELKFAPNNTTELDALFLINKSGKFRNVHREKVLIRVFILTAAPGGVKELVTFALYFLLTMQKIVNFMISIEIKIFCSQTIPYMFIFCSLVNWLPFYTEMLECFELRQMLW